MNFSVMTRSHSDVQTGLCFLDRIQTNLRLCLQSHISEVLLSCINQKIANFIAEKAHGPEKCPVYVKLPCIGNVSSKFENQISKAITSLF